MKKFTLFLSAMFFSVMSFATEVTVSIEAYAAANGWENSKPYTSLTMDEVVTVTANPTTGTYNNTGKYYDNGKNWRMYQNENPAIVVKAAAGYVLTSVTFDYTSQNTGTMIDAAGVPVATGKAYALANVASATFSVGNTDASVSNGQARITSIKVTYEAGDDAGETTEVVVSDLDYAMAFYEEEEGFTYWEIQLFNLDATGENVELPLAIVAVEAKSKTALNGTYDMLMAVYGTGEDAEGYVEGVYMSEDAAGTLTIKNVDNEGTYSFVGSFVGEDGKTYKINTKSYIMWVEDGVTGEEIVLNENAGDTPNPSGMITCAEAAQIAAADNYKGTDNVTVYGYVVELIKEKVDDKTGRNKQSFWMSDTKGGEKQFQAFYAFVPENFFKVGDQVAVTGILQNYKGTIEIADGEAVLLEVTTGVEDVVLNENLMKVIKNGQMYIIRDGKAYNVLGAQVK